MTEGFLCGFSPQRVLVANRAMLLQKAESACGPLSGRAEPRDRLHAARSAGYAQTHWHRHVQGGAMLPSGQS